MAITQSKLRRKDKFGRKQKIPRLVLDTGKRWKKKQKKRRRAKTRKIARS